MTERPVRGIRQSIPPGTVLARLNGVGPPQPVSLADLTNAIVRTGKVATGSGSSFITAVGPFLTVVAGTLDLETSATQLRTVVFPVVGRPPSAQKYSVVVTQPGTLLANGGVPEAYVPALPMANTSLGLNSIHGGVTTSLGTVAVNTGGTVTFPAFAAVSMVAGDVIQMTAPGIVDPVFADASFSFQYAVSEAVATPTTEEWLAGTVTALGAGVTLTAGTISASGGVQQWTAGTVSTIGTGITVTAGTISAAGGGGSSQPLYAVGSNTTLAIGFTPTNPTLADSCTITIAASAVSHTYVVNGFIGWSASHQLRFRVFQDGTAGSQLAPPLAATNGYSGNDTIDGQFNMAIGPLLVVLPGDNASHTINFTYEASGSTGGFTLYNRAVTAQLLS